MRRHAAALVVATALGLPAAHAATVTLDVDADTYLRGGQFAGTAYGTVDEEVLRTERGPEAGRRFRATVLRFDLASLGQAVVDAATLRVTQASTGAQQVEVFALADGADGWDEATLTLNDAVAAGFADPASLTSLGTIDLAANAYGATLSLTGPALATALGAAGADQLVTFVVLSTQPDNSSSARLASKESQALAGATLDVQVVPLPPAAALFPLGLAALARRRPAS